MLTDDPRFLEPYRRGREQLAARLADLERARPAALRPRVERIDRDLDAYIADYTEPLIARPRATNVLAATTEGKARLDALRAQFAALSSAQAAITGAAPRPARRRCASACSCSPPAAPSSPRCC